MNATRTRQRRRAVLAAGAEPAVVREEQELARDVTSLALAASGLPVTPETHEHLLQLVGPHAASLVAERHRLGLTPGQLLAVLHQFLTVGTLGIELDDGSTR